MGKLWNFIKELFFPTKKEEIQPVFQPEINVNIEITDDKEDEEEPTVIVEKDKLIWISKIKVEKRIRESELPEYIKKGYKRGRKKAKHKK